MLQFAHEPDIWELASTGEATLIEFLDLYNNRFDDRRPYARMKDKSEYTGIDIKQDRISTLNRKKTTQRKNMEANDNIMLIN